MAEQQKTESDPSIEEILDSIRQIISEEEEETPAAVIAPMPEPAVSFREHLEDDIIELTDKVEEPAAPEPVSFTPPPVIEAVPLISMPAPTPVQTPPVAAAISAKPPPAPETPMPPQNETPTPDSSLTEILSRKAAESVAGAFAELSQRSEIQKGGGITIEDIVRQELRPLLHTWLDRHLPGLVERLLQKELERISRRVQGE